MQVSYELIGENIRPQDLSDNANITGNLRLNPEDNIQCRLSASAHSQQREQFVSLEFKRDGIRSNQITEALGGLYN